MIFKQERNYERRNHGTSERKKEKQNNQKYTKIDYPFSHEFYKAYLKTEIKIIALSDAEEYSI